MYTRKFCLLLLTWLYLLVIHNDWHLFTHSCVRYFEIMCKLTRSFGTNQLKLGFQTNPNLGFKPTQTWVWIYCIWIKNDVGYKVTGYLEYFCTITYFFFFFPKLWLKSLDESSTCCYFSLTLSFFIFLRENWQMIIQSAHWSISFQTKLMTSLRMS